MDEDLIINHIEWENDELVWGKGMFNWCRDWSQKESKFTDIDETIKIPF